MKAALVALDEAFDGVGDSWVPFLHRETAKPYFRRLLEFVRGRRAAAKVYPPPKDVFTALKLTPLDGVRVVVLGQDPYHQPGQAHGLAFSVPRGMTPPPSLRNMIKESAEDCGTGPAEHGNLESWAKQGVLLLNTLLTVEDSAPMSHKGKGWEEFTAAVLAEVNRQRGPVVFLLWGKPSQMNAKGVDAKKHHILLAAHPSPLSASKGFFGCKHFSKTNAFLESKGFPAIQWDLKK